MEFVADKNHKVVYNEDGLIVTRTKDTTTVGTSNKGFVELPQDLLIGSRIVDMYFENTYVNNSISYKDEEWAKDRNYEDKWEFIGSNTVFVVRATDGQLYSLQIQADEENNSNGYVGMFNAKTGKMLHNQIAGQNYLQAMEKF